jgi:peptidyl-tRNA hydrolase
MYFVVRKDVPLAFDEGMALAGGATVLCADTFRSSSRWAPAFEEWSERPRKVALRAGPDELARLRAELDHVAVGEGRLVCLPPRRMSDRSELLAGLRPFTDARDPSEPLPAPARPALRYVIRAGVMKTLGKGMAQAGHAALLAADTLGARYPEEFAAWRAAGRPGEVEVVDEETWARRKASPDTVAVTDAGLTQVAPGTETVLALPPR